MSDSSIDMVAVGQRLRARRAALGRKIADVALEAGLSMPYVANLERGRGNPTLEVMLKIASALGLDLGELLGDNSAVQVSIDVSLASLPRSLREFSLTEEFNDRCRWLAERQHQDETQMRTRLLTGMASAPQRSRGEPTSTDWRRLLDAYAAILG